jgi:hypothetical protein
VTVYALKLPDGRFAYHLPKPDALAGHSLTGVFADGQPMTALHGGWWASDAEATLLTATAQPAPKTTGHKLTDPAAESRRYPLTLTVEEWRERADRRAARSRARLRRPGHGPRGPGASGRG